MNYAICIVIDALEISLRRVVKNLVDELQEYFTKIGSIIWAEIKG